MKSCQNLAENAAKQFALNGEIESCIPYGNGHINDTFSIVCKDKSGEKNRYIIQAINKNVFKNCDQVIDNIEKVTEFLRKKGLGKRDVMTLIRTKDNKSSYIDDKGNTWRVYNFIENSLCLEHPENPDDFYQCGFAFGKFQRDLSDFPADVLYEVLPDFHNTVKRYNTLLESIEKDEAKRAAGVSEEIKFIKDRKDFYSTLLNCHDNGSLMLRVSHNDTKSNNVLLDADTHKALCVIDLDTIMPGFSVTDFGDAIRFGANTAAEDEPDVSKVSLDLRMFEAFASGFLDGCGGYLPDDEIMLLPEGAKMMTLECGIRFLTDYLDGDKYFKTAYPEHNLVRCHTQLKLAADMENHWDEMKNIVSKYCGKGK